MKEKHISFVMAAAIAVVFIGGAVSYYSPDVPDVCPDAQHDETTEPTTPTTEAVNPLIDSGRITQ